MKTALPLPPHTPDSPVGRVRDHDGQVLLLGVGHDADTSLHVAELLARVPYGVPRHITARADDGGPVRIDYRENDHCCQRFALADGWLRTRGLQAEGPVGHGTARLARAQNVVMIFCAGAVSQLETWDYKPELIRHDGKPLAGGGQYYFSAGNGTPVEADETFIGREPGKAIRSVAPAASVLTSRGTAGSGSPRGGGVRVASSGLLSKSPSRSRLSMVLCCVCIFFCTTSSGSSRPYCVRVVERMVPSIKRCVVT